MHVRRIVPDISSERRDESREFYSGFLGLDVAMDLGWIMTFVSPDVTIQLRHERRRSVHVGDPLEAVLCERWRCGPPTSTYGGRRQTALSCVG
jgi:hypothetical protein